MENVANHGAQYRSGILKSWEQVLLHDGVH
jgi:hypothetical protein